ncbi:uncharacterized protein LOC117770601 [Hippoglossus hippoglossus]|uniref:uncharacterized protein LOC117770601 n=1 Tax=Hippoglossus hippoglossus TaxID=8267 RepID=UPI00148E7093|nr:uncharacterized protein LOC117770601 [Hippoglossus hippoglossus]
MRIQMTMGLLSILVSTGLVVVIMGQYKDLATVEEESDRAKEDFQRTFDRVSNKELFKDSVEKLLQQGKTALEELEPLVSNLVQEMQKKEKEDETCKNEKQPIRDELAKTEKELIDTEAPLKAESDAWKQEIAKLQEQLKGHSPICNFLREDQGAVQLCAISDV